MLKKIKLWWINRKHKQPEIAVEFKSYTYEQLKNAYQLGYTDGKRDGLNIARVQATKSLKEILWQQNNQSQK